MVSAAGVFETCGLIYNALAAEQHAGRPAGSLRRRADR